MEASCLLFAVLEINRSHHPIATAALKQYWCLGVVHYRFVYVIIGEDNNQW